MQVKNYNFTEKFLLKDQLLQLQHRIFYAKMDTLHFGRRPRN